MMGRKFRSARARISTRCCRVKFEPQGLEGLLTRIADVFSSIKLSICTKSTCQFSSGYNQSLSNKHSNPSNPRKRAWPQGRGSYQTIIVPTFHFHRISSNTIRKPRSRQKNITPPWTNTPHRQPQRPTRPVRKKNIPSRQLKLLIRILFRNSKSPVVVTLGGSIPVRLVRF